MKRRGFLQALLAGSAAAVAAHFGVTEAMVPEIKQELAKELTKDHVQVAMPGSDPWMGHNAIWWSVGNIAAVWRDEVARKLADKIDHDLLYNSCRRMARVIDHEAMKARVAKDKQVIVDVPKVRYRSFSDFDLVAGLETKAGLWGTHHRVGYIQEKVYTGEKIDESKRLWLPGAA